MLGQKPTANTIGRDLERAGENLMEGEFSKAGGNISDAASHTATNVGNKLDALGDKMNANEHQAKAEFYD
jgi:hypothetical protein